MQFAESRIRREHHHLRSIVFASAMVLAACGIHVRAHATEGFHTLRLLVDGHAAHAVAATWGKEGQHDGVISIDLDSEFYGLATGHPSPLVILEVEPASPRATVTVRQRSVSYLNVGDSGPHMSVPGSERRGPWRSLKALSRERFRVDPTVEQSIPMRYQQFSAALGNDPRWTELMKTCRTPNDGACYVVTDQEFEVTTVEREGKVRRRIIRVTNPNGC